MASELSANARNDHNLGLGIFCGLTAGAIWGLVFLAPRMLPEFSPLEHASARYLIYGLASLVLIAPAWRRLSRMVTGADWVRLFWLSLTGNIIYYLLMATSVQAAGVVPASLIIGLLPVTITVVGSFEAGAIKLKRLAWPLLLILAGMICINLDLFFYEADSHGGWLQKLLGVLCAFAALAAWTYYAIANARYLRRHHGFTNREWSLLTGLATGALAVFLGIPAFVMPSEAVMVPRDWERFWLIATAIGIGASIIGNSLWNTASRVLPMTLSGQMIVFETLFALIYGFLYDARWPRELEFAAIALLLFGVIWSAGRHRRTEVGVPVQS